MNWGILGISKTNDLREIKAAYMNRLKTVNPEDSPEEFMELRAAYEEATRLAQEAITEPGPAESEELRDRLEELYWDFKRRKDSEAWSELLSDPVFNDKETRDEAEEKLISFLEEHWYLPQAVWQELDRKLVLLGRTEELYAHFPVNFVDNAIIRGIREKESLPLELFSPGEDGGEIDEYISAYYAALNHSEDQGKEIDRFMGLSEHHPYGDMLKEVYDLENGDMSAEARCRKIMEQYPGQDNLCLILERYYARQKDYDKAIQILEADLSDRKNNMWARIDYIVCLLGLERYRSAYDEICLVQKRFTDVESSVPSIRMWINQCCGKLIEELEKRDDGAGLSDEEKLEGAWWYIEIQKIDKAYSLLASVEEESSKTFRYYNALYWIYFVQDENESAIENAERALECIRSMVPDGTEETELNMQRAQEVMAKIAQAYYMMGKKEEAFDLYSRAFRESNYSFRVADSYVWTLYVDRNYPEMVRVIEQYEQGHSKTLRLTFFKAEALFYMNADREAIIEFNRFIDEGTAYYGMMSAYVIKTWILIRNGIFEQAASEIDALRERINGDSPETLWLTAYLAHEKRFADTAIEDACEERNLSREEVVCEFAKELIPLYEEVEDMLDSEEGSGEWIPEFYRQYADVIANSYEDEADYDTDRIIAILDKGIEYDDKCVGLLLYKARILYNMGDRYLDAAYDLVYQIFKLGKLSRNSKRDLARYTYDNASLYADRSLEVIEDLIKGGYPEGDGEEEAAKIAGDKCADRFFAGWSAYLLGDYEKAEYHYNILLNIEPTDPFGMKGLALISLAKGDYEAALGYIDRALENVKERNYDEEVIIALHWIRVTALRRLGRCDEAVEAVRAMPINATEQEQLIHRIYLQFGRFDDDYEHLMKWKANRRKYKGKKDPRASLIEYNILRGQNRKANRYYMALLFDINPSISDTKFEEIANFRTCKGMTVDAAKFWEGTDSKDYDYYPGLYRRAMYVVLDALTGINRRSPHKDVVRLADTSIEEEAGIVNGYTNEKGLYLRNSALFHAAKRDREGAMKAVAQMRECTLCERCPYTTCVEADVCEMYVELLCKNKKRARELAFEGMKKWPDQIAFRIGKRRTDFI